jgi:ribonuclease PH
VDIKRDIQRHDGRAFDELRPISYMHDVLSNAVSSILWQAGNTKVLCAVTIQNTVPPFVKGTGSGWITAEYALLPTSTAVRTNRESVSLRRNERSVEISRLIGRSLRSITNLALLGERTIFIDCDVLQADGSTRAASIAGACIALFRAQERWLDMKIISAPLLRTMIAAVSVGVSKDHVLLDPDYEEDSAIDADFTFVMTRESDIIEIQGGAEKMPVAWPVFDHVRKIAQKGVAEIFKISAENKMCEKVVKDKKVPLFSLFNRQLSTP